MVVVVWLWKKKKREKHNHRWLDCFVNEPRVGKLRDARLRNACVRSWIRTCVHACLSVWWCPVHPREPHCVSFYSLVFLRGPRQPVASHARRATRSSFLIGRPWSNNSGYDFVFKRVFWLNFIVWNDSNRSFESLTRDLPILRKFEFPLNGVTLVTG